MPRLPKDPALRQRRNRASTKATLTAEDAPRRRAPSLPKREGDKAWHALTRAYWRVIWRSPMAAEYLEADVPGLFMLAEMIDQFWAEPTPALLAEIRLQRQCFGLTPIDRRRLQWEVEKVEAVTQKRKPPVEPMADDVNERRTVLRALEDPRLALQ